MYIDIISSIDEKRFMLSELFFIGFGCVSLFKLNLNTESGRRKERKIAEIYGEKYAPYYRYVILGGQLTYALTVAPLGFMMGAWLNDAVYMILTVAAAGALVFYLDIEINNAVSRKRDEILSDYPKVLSKLTLLVNAGMVVREAFSKVAFSSERALYKEMQITAEEIKNGMSEIDAFFNLAQRCSVKEIRKFASILTQNIQKGSSELTAALKYMTAESFEQKKHFAKRKGELAGQKLLIPVMMMFIGILIMVIVPIVSNML